MLNPLNAELNPICHLLASLGVHHFLHVSRMRVNYTHVIYYAPSTNILPGQKKMTNVSNVKIFV
jgi:hypothetical protein